MVSITRTRDTTIKAPWPFGKPWFALHGEFSARRRLEFSTESKSRRWQYGSFCGSISSSISAGVCPGPSFPGVHFSGLTPPKAMVTIGP
jgi:hypothetical protein